MTSANPHSSIRALWCLLAVLSVCGRSAFAQPPSPAPPEIPPPISASAQRVYEDARAQLLQVRTLLKGQDTQASVGSGFLVSDAGHIITNYHVVSQAALQPERYRLVFSTADRTEGPLHCWPLTRFTISRSSSRLCQAPFAGRRPLSFRPRATPMSQGERIYSLGNPLDVGFAVIEGTYNGLVERSFYPTIFFAGSLNPGVSGGPTLDQQGRVMGINVAARTDGEQVSFLVPAAFAEDLLERGRTATPLSKPAYPELTRQLTMHQAALSERFLAQRWRLAGHPQYAIPLPQEEFMRCWGRSTPADAKGLEFERSDCQMESRLFVSGWLTTGTAHRPARSLRRTQAWHPALCRPLLRQLQERAFGRSGKDRTAPQCHERYVDRGGLPLRAVLCMSAYKKLTGLYDVSVLVATVDAARAGVQGRFDAVWREFRQRAQAERALPGGIRMDADGDDERPMRLAVVEILDRDGHTRQLVPVWHWPVTIGRAIECDVVLDDPHVAARHATLDDKDGQLQLQVGETRQRRAGQADTRRLRRSDDRHLPSAVRSSSSEARGCVCVASRILWRRSGPWRSSLPTAGDRFSRWRWR